MPQSGFHGLVGLATVRATANRVPRLARPAFAAAVVLGAMLPDIDMYPTVVAVLTKAKDQNADEIVYAYHRTASHSVFVILLLALVGVLVRKKPTWSWAFWGLALGTLTHLVLDVFFWFAQLDALWPLSRYPEKEPYFNIINIWGSNHKGVVANVRDACEFLAFALLLGSIRRISIGREGVSDKAIKFQLIVEWILWACWIVALVTAFTQTPETQQRIVNTPYLLFFLPFCWSRVWVFRQAIADWAGRKNGWEDWDGTVACDPQAIEMPESEDEVAQIVQSAIKNGGVVRVYGAGHSWSPLVPTSGTLVSLDKMPKPSTIPSGSKVVTLPAGMRLRDVGPYLQDCSLTMCNLGAITPQSIAGAIGSGTHGTGMDYGILGTQITGVRVVDGLGQVRDFDIHNHPREMSALRLSLGCLGIIVQVTIECIDDHSVELNEIPMSYADFLNSFESLYRNNERIRAYWFPGSDRVFVNTINRIDSPLKPGSPYSWFEAVIQRRLVLSLLWGIGRSVPDWVPACNRFQEKAGFRKSRSVNPCFNAITTPIMALHQEAEVAVPIDRAREAVEAYGEWVAKSRLTVNVPSEIRFCKADDILLSPGYGVDTCYIGGYNSMYRQHDPFFEGFCDVMQDQFGARPHWGKIGAPTREEALKLFPGFPEFEKVRREFDPDGVFANKYIRDLFAL